MENNKNKRVQMCFDIDPEHKEFIKTDAKSRKISMNQWVYCALRREIDKQKKYDERL